MWRNRTVGSDKKDKLAVEKREDSKDAAGGASWQQMLDVLSANRKQIVSHLQDKEKREEKDSEQRKERRTRTKEAEKLEKIRSKESRDRDKDRGDSYRKGHKRSRSNSKKASWADMLRVVAQPAKARKYAAVRPLFDLTGLEPVHPSSPSTLRASDRGFLDVPAPLEESKRYLITCKACQLELEVESDLDLYHHIKNGNHGPIWSSKFREMLLKGDKDIRRYSTFYAESIEQERGKTDTKARSSASTTAKNRSSRRNSTSLPYKCLTGSGAATVKGSFELEDDPELATFLFIAQSAAHDWSVFQMNSDEQGRAALQQFQTAQASKFMAVTASMLSWNIKAAHKVVIADIQRVLESSRVPFVAVTCTGWSLQGHANAPLGGHRYVKCRLHYWSKKWRMRSILVSCNYVPDVQENARTIQRIQLETIEKRILPDNCKVAIFTSDLDESRFGDGFESGPQCVLLAIEMAVKTWLAIGEQPGLNVPFSMHYLCETVRLLVAAINLSHHTRRSLGLDQATLLPDIPDIVVAPSGSCWSLLFDMLFGFLKNLDAIAAAVDHLKLLDDLGERRADVARELLLGDKRLAARYLRDVVLLMKVMKAAAAGLVPEAAGSPDLVLYPSAAAVPRFVHVLHESLMDFLRMSPAAATAPVFGGELLNDLDRRLGKYVGSFTAARHSQSIPSGMPQVVQQSQIRSSGQHSLAYHSSNTLTAPSSHQPMRNVSTSGEMRAYQGGASLSTSGGMSLELPAARSMNMGDMGDTFSLRVPTVKPAAKLHTLLEERDDVPIGLRAAMLHPSEFALPWLSKDVREMVREAVLEDCEKLFCPSDMPEVSRELKLFWSRSENVQANMSHHTEFWRHQKKYVHLPLLARLYLCVRATTRPVVNLISAEYRDREAKRIHGATHAHMLSDNLDDWERSEVIKHWAIGKSTVQLQEAYLRSQDLH